LEILSFDILPSTQTYLIEKIEEGSLKIPVAVLTLEQNYGVGSRDNTWAGGKGNFFASIAVDMFMLPEDLPLSSASIYFSFIMKKILKEFNKDIWLKWPNDFYINDDKIGGTITKKINNVLVCGIGINLKKSENGYRALQSDISPGKLLEKYLSELQKFPKWKQIFSEYEIEFELSRKFSVHIENYQNSPEKGCKMSLAHACLCEDGSLILGGKRVYSLR
jgi:BirA family biotin operon repressor/biotin-[acetyl-CoA-carboxylase] ligase